MPVKTIGELLEFLRQFPEDTKVTYDYGNGAEVEFLEDLGTVDIH